MSHNINSIDIIFQLFLLATLLKCGNTARILKENDTNTTLSFTFFMHDILGGSSPSGRTVAGIVTTPQVKGIPFLKPASGVFPLKGGIPLITKGTLNKDTLPLIASINGGMTRTIINNNAEKKLPYVTAWEIPARAFLQEIMFGTITVVDDELTEGHELGNSVIGRAQGFYLASSKDGSSHTMAFTAFFNGESNQECEDTLSFFGVHRIVKHESLIAIVGGTGKYENAKGYARIETLHLPDQHITDGIDTIIQYTVYLSG